MPERVTLSRAKGWRMPPNTVVVARGQGRVFGNPFKVAKLREVGFKGPDAGLKAVCAEAFKQWLNGSDRDWMGAESEARRAAILSRLPELRGKNLACWCKPGEPCHADVLLEIANR
jgi:hypothetical protein